MSQRPNPRPPPPPPPLSLLFSLSLLVKGLPHSFLMTQDGKPYILSLDVGQVQNTSEERSRGYTVAVQSTFASREDYEYYDKVCEAHKAFKSSVVGKHEGASQTLMVWFESERT